MLLQIPSFIKKEKLSLSRADTVAAGALTFLWKSSSGVVERRLTRR